MGSTIHLSVFPTPMLRFFWTSPYWFQQDSFAISVVLLLRQLFLLCYLLYVPIHLHLFPIPTSFWPFYSLILWTSSWCLTLLPCLSVLDGTCVRLCSVHRQWLNLLVFIHRSCRALQPSCIWESMHQRLAGFGEEQQGWWTGRTVSMQRMIM